jgi:hypothetical protein
MDYRAFELANDQCKPKHFGPPTTLQRRVDYETTYLLSSDPPDSPDLLPRSGFLHSFVRWLRRIAGQ